MDLQHFLQGTPVELPQMLEARERRVWLQQAILQKYPVTLVSFTLNIAGPIKVFPLAVRSYEEGLELIRCQCKAWGLPIVHTQEIRESSGFERFLSVDAPALKVKEILSQLEGQISLGRLFDIDVLDTDGSKLSRTQLGLPERTCLVCGRPAFECSRARNHSLDDILRQSVSIMWDYFAHRYAVKVSTAASRALLYEVLATPKPGLVDKNNSGAHRDMDIATFETSAVTLLPYLRQFVLYGVDHCNQDPKRFLYDLRPIGIQAEIDMLRATGGVNTHKGILFSMGILLCALGVCYGREELPGRERLRQLSTSISAPIKAELDSITSDTARSHGEQLYLEHGVLGARGEAVNGFPGLFETALPMMDALLEGGETLNDAGVVTLLHIMAEIQDTNIISRSSYSRMAELQAQLRDLLSRHLSPAQLVEESGSLDRRFIEENISPGGSADLLALAYLIRFLEDTGLMSKHSV